MGLIRQKRGRRSGQTGGGGPSGPVDQADEIGAGVDGDDPADTELQGRLLSQLPEAGLLQAACLLKGRWLRVFAFLGEISLEMYLLHLFLFYRVLNGFPKLDIITVGVLSIGLSVVLSWLIHWLFSLLFSAAKAVGNNKKGG